MPHPRKPLIGRLVQNTQQSLSNPARRLVRAVLFNQPTNQPTNQPNLEASLSDNCWLPIERVRLFRRVWVLLVP